MCNELGHLTQSFNDVKGNNILFFIPKSKVPRGKKVTHAQIVCSIRPQKTDTHRIWLTAGGNIVNYKGCPITLVHSIETIKMRWNSVFSTPGAKHCMADLEDVFLMAALEEHEYLRINMSLMPETFIKNTN